MGGTFDNNLVAGGIAALVASTITFLFARYGKGLDAREQAEAALMGIGPAIIAEQNKRIAQLSDDIAAIWEREHDCRVQLNEAQKRIDMLEHRMNGD